MKNIYFKLSWLMVRFSYWCEVMSIHFDSYHRTFKIKAIMAAKISNSDKILMLNEMRNR